MNSSSFVRTIALLLVLFTILPTLSACEVINGLINPATNTIDDIIDEVERTRGAIAQQSDQWRAELPKLLERLNDLESNMATDARGILTDTTNQVQDLATQAIQFTADQARDVVAHTGAEFRCNADFVKEGALAQLQYIIDDLKFWEQHKEHLTTKPSQNVCAINPSVLSLYPSGGTYLIDTSNMIDPNIIHVYGYNFWAEALPVLELQNAAGQRMRDANVVPAYVTRYQLDLNFATADFRDAQSGWRAVLRWPNGAVNTVSLSLRAPASLKIIGVSFTPRVPVATQQLVYPTVTIKNEGGSDSERFDVRWTPGPGLPTLSTSVTRAVRPGETTEVRMGNYTYQRCGTFATQIFLSNGNDSRNESLTVAPYCPPIPAPTPYPEKKFEQDRVTWDWRANGMEAKTLEYGGPCDAGYHRADDSHQSVTGVQSVGSGYLVGIPATDAGCYFAGWVTGDVHVCKAKVRIWAAMSRKVDCTIQIYEIGDQLPAPTPGPACSCRP